MSPHEMIEMLKRANDDLARNPGESFFKNERDFWIVSLVGWARG